MSKEKIRKLVMEHEASCGEGKYATVNVDTLTTAILALLNEAKEKEAKEFGEWLQLNYFGDITGIDLDVMYEEYKKAVK